MPPITKPKTGLAAKVAASRSGQRRPESLWLGPMSNGALGGITQSMISHYLCCKERFRIHFVEGLWTPERFSHRVEYGNMWHVCEEHFGAGKPMAEIFAKLLVYAKELSAKHQFDREEIRKWYEVCKIQFPLYVEWWSKHKDVVNRKPLLQEHKFCVPYVLPSGRVAFLRGKWDSVDLVELLTGQGVIWLQENKTKGEVDPMAIEKQLRFDLQTMLYLTALGVSIEKNPKRTLPSLIGKIPIVAGVRYNVVRRPLSGGKGNIRQKKGQTEADYFKELSEVIGGATGAEWGTKEGDHHFFMRWNSEVSEADIERFKREFLTPLLENLCDDYEWWDHCQRNHKHLPTLPEFDGEHRMKLFEGRHCPRHFRLPYGIYNPVAEGKPTDLDDYLSTGSEVGLTRDVKLFPELQ